MELKYGVHQAQAGEAAAIQLWAARVWFLSKILPERGSQCAVRFPV